MLSDLKAIEKRFREISVVSGKLMTLKASGSVKEAIEKNSEMFGLDTYLASKVILDEINFYRKIAKDQRKNFEPTVSHQISVIWMFSKLRSEDRTGKLVAFCHDWIEDRRDFLIRGGEWEEAEKERLFLELRMEFREYLRKLGLKEKEQEAVFENVLALTRNRNESYASYVQNIVSESIESADTNILIIKLIDKLHNSCSFLYGSSDKEEALLRDAVKGIYIMKKAKESLKHLRANKRIKELIELNMLKTAENLGQLNQGKDAFFDGNSEEALCSMLDKDKKWSNVPYSERALMLNGILNRI